MATEIHPTAIVESGAVLDDRVSIGAFAYIGSKVECGAGTTVHHHATVEGKTILGRDNEIYSYALIGGKSQDLKSKGGAPGLRIGDNNIFREYVTVHCHSVDGEYTILGSNNYCLAYSHIGHECVIGDHFILGHSSTLGGHMVVEDFANVGGHTAFHPNCRIGRCAYIGGCSKVVQDIPPFMLGDGSPATIKTINKIGMERHGFSEEAISLARQVYKILYREGLNRSQALDRLRDHEKADDSIVKSIIDFAENSTRGLA